MTENQRYLTKSRFTLGMDCPTKLFYAGNPDIYPDASIEDTFLKSLAENGYHVGALAQQYHPGGHAVSTLNPEEALAQTEQLLEQDEVTIYEAAFRFDDLFIRVDILVKKGNQIDLIEVKAKSYDKEKNGNLATSNGKPRAKWLPYLLDIAFQKYVVTKALPDSQVRAWLMPVDKQAVCPIHTLHQKISIDENRDPSGSPEVQSEPLTSDELEQRLLCKIPVDMHCEWIQQHSFVEAIGPTDFVERINWLAAHYRRNEKIVSPVKPQCAKCEFRPKTSDGLSELKSGFEECWREQLGWGDEDFKEPNVLDIWNLSAGKKKELFDKKLIKLDHLQKHHVQPKPQERPGLSASQRQWLQVEKHQNRDSEPYFDGPGLLREMKSWKYPLHFIDFETTMPAIPFHRGRRPYEQIAFQFSHHTVSRDHHVCHAGEFIDLSPGSFPNYAFLRELKRQLSQDDGTIFRYSQHENTVLLQIYEQLLSDSDAPSDRDELLEFIRTISTAGDKWSGKRTMVDLREMVVSYYYSPRTKGSNSIKKVLPAIIEESTFLRETYSQPVYGAQNGIPSLNFSDHQWIHIADGDTSDPYSTLVGLSEYAVADGGNALAAYARAQRIDISSEQHAETVNALLRYCELDTLAMVMIYQAWADRVGLS